MKKEISRAEAEKKIKVFFERDKLDSKEVRKIKRLAMTYNIKLGRYRKRFCKKCFSDLKDGKVRIKNGFKTVECPGCKERMRWKIEK